MGILYSQSICQAAYNNDIYQVTHLVKMDAKNLNIQDEIFGDTPIIAACRRGNLQTVKYLLEQNADVSIRNKKERTCLHYAARRTFTVLDSLMIILEKQRRTVTLMRLILNSNVDIDAVDYEGNTALHYACQRKSDHLIRLLLEKNADMSIKNRDNETPLDIAKRLKFRKTVNILKKLQ
ncbi:ankyrin repeat domain-containing protein 22 [Arapaima gigas]